MKLEIAALKVGWLTNAWKNGIRRGEAATRRKKFVKKYFPGVKNAKFPEGPFEDAGNIIIACGRRFSFRSLIRSGRVSELADPLGQLAGYVNEQFSGADYVQAQRVRDLLQKKMDAMFDTSMYWCRDHSR